MRAPVRRASSMSRWTISSSAIAGQPGHAELAAAAALVHHRPLGEPGDLAVLGEHDVEPERVLQRPAHQQRVLHAVAVVGEEPHAGGGQLGERGERPRRARPTVMHPAGSTSHSPARLALGAHELDHARRVLRRVGVRHRHDRGEPAERGGPAAGLDRLGLLVAGLAQVGVEVDEARRDDAAAGVEHVVAVEPRRRRRRSRRRRRARRRGARRPGRPPARR